MRPVLCNLIFCHGIKSVKGKYNLEGIFYRIHAAVYPCWYRCYVVVGWCGDCGSHNFGLRFLPPDRSSVLFATPPHPFTLSVTAPYFNGMIEAVLPLGGEGVYWFEVILNGESLDFFPIHVETVPAGALHRPV
ncbi:MAG: hypothetical protein K6T65_11095 [Peptococcaceae bacterium]|nr:hypothetical protein [Peptococcaceae bacterium]